MSESGGLVECDECGRSVEKIWRVYNGHRHCSTCYAREFKRRLCPRCGNYARLPRREPDAVCPKCQTDMPCIRCGKSDYSIGKITPYGPVCNACSVYFRKHQPCDNCGALSPLLTRHGQRRLCPKCARAGHRSCQACGRHRQLQTANDGRQLCRKCAELGNIACPLCGEGMPAGYGSRCEKCYWGKLLERRIAINIGAFGIPAMAQHFASFGMWLGCRVGTQKAAITVHRYLPFFVAIEHEWRGIPSYAALLQQFGAEQLRRVRLPMTWLSETAGITPDARVREEDSERRRIDALMASITQGTLGAEALGAYRTLLDVKLAAGKTTLHSIRLALRPAVSLLLAADVSGKALPDQIALDRYVQQAPGQLAAITGFVNLLNQKYSTGLSMQNIIKKSQVMRRKKLEDELVEMIRRGEAGSPPSKEWISAALEYFHELPRRGSRSITNGQIKVDKQGRGVSISFNGQLYWIPVPFHMLLNETMRST